MRELQAELDALQAARAALIGEGNGGARTRSPRAARRGSGRPRGATRTRRAVGSRSRREGGTRADQALELVRAQPGITIPQIAESMHIEPNYLYRVLPKLQEQGKVARDGQGWRLIESDA